MSKRAASILLICLGSLLIVSAVALLGYNMWDDSRAQSEVESVMEQIEQLMPSETKEGIWPEATIDPDSLFSGELIPDYILNPNMDMPTELIGEYRYIGVVEAPTIELKMPVMETWSYPQMKISPCRYVGSVYQGKMVICGHNYASHFGRLKNLQVGDPVYFTDMHGNVFRYRVKQKENIHGYDIDAMQTGDWALSLFTCTYNGVYRVTIRCEQDMN